MGNNQRDWLHTLPPIRAPRGRRHHQHHIEPVEVVFKAIGYGTVWMLILELWLVELEIWAIIWFYYGMFLGIRWAYRNNVIGQTVSGVLRRHEQRQQVADPGHRTPVALRDWNEAPVRRRS